MDDALKLAEDKDKEKAKWIKNYFDKELFDPLQFHIAISLSLIPAEKALPWPFLPVLPCLRG